MPVSDSGQDWRRAHPYTLAHLATHAQRAGRLDDLLLDPEYLIHAAPAGLLAALPAARGADAELAAMAYQRAVHQLRGRPADDRFSYLELACRITHATELARRIEQRSPRRRWSVPWAHWPPEHPHRVLGGQLGRINGIACAVLDNGKTIVASIGEDARLRFWDLVTAEPAGAYTVGTSPLIAIRFIRLAGNRTVIALLGTNGRLHIWDMLTASIAHEFSVVPRWQRRPRLREANCTLRPLQVNGYEQFLVVSARGMATSIWDLSAGHRIAFLPSRADLETISLADLIDGRPAIMTEEYLLLDPATGRQLPYEHRWIRFSWVQLILDVLVRQTHREYYSLPDGRPVIAARFFRRSGDVIVWDLTLPNPIGRWNKPTSPVRVNLSNGQLVDVPVHTNMTGEAERAAASPDRVVRLGPIAHRTDQPGNRSHSAADLQFRVNGSFVQVEFPEHSAESMPDHIPLTLAGHTADVTAYDWTRLPDGHLIIVTGSDDGTVRTWDVSSISPTPGQLDEQVPTALEMIFSAQTADGTALGLTVSVHGESTLWDLRTGRLLKALRERQFSPCAVCIARTAQDRPVAVSFDTDATARIWALPEGLEITQFPTDPIGLPSSVGWQRLPDGTSVAITTGHGRKAVIWDLATGRMRAVLVGHRGQSSCVTCAQDSSGRPLALTGGHDNRVNVWNLRTGRRRNCFRIVPLRIFIARPSAGRAAAVRVLPLRDGQVFVLVATADGQLRLFKPRGFGRGARRLAAIDATAALVVGNLTNGRGIVVSVRADGVVQVWSADNFAGERAGMVPLCEIDVEITVNDISAVGDDTFVLATPNGLTAVRLYPQTLKSDLEG